MYNYVSGLQLKCLPVEGGPLPETLTVQEVQYILKLDRNAVYNLIHSNSFPVIRVGNLIRIPKTVLRMAVTVACCALLNRISNHHVGGNELWQHREGLMVKSSFWQLTNKTWVYQITIGRKEDGSLARKSFKGRTKAICKQRMDEWLAEQQTLHQDKARLSQQEIKGPNQSFEESKILFEGAFLTWLKLYKSPSTRKPSTYASYIDTYNTHFADFFGQMRLYAVT